MIMVRLLTDSEISLFVVKAGLLSLYLHLPFQLGFFVYISAWFYMFIDMNTFSWFSDGVNYACAALVVAGLATYLGFGLPLLGRFLDTKLASYEKAGMKTR